MGSPVPTEEPMGGGFGGEELGGGEPPVNDKPFDDTPFDAGVEANEDEDPAKYIQQLSGKLGQSLRKHAGENGQPDFDLEKFAINSVLSATNSGQMDQQDQTDIINKVKSSSTDGSGGEDAGGDNVDLGSDLDAGSEYMGGDLKGNEDDELDFSDIDMEEGFNANPNGKTVFQDESLGVKDGGMEENKYLNLENQKKSRIFVDETKTIKSMIRKTLMTETPTITPTRTPKVVPETAPSRRSKPWRTPILPEGVPDPEPKAERETIECITAHSLNDNEAVITFDVGDVRFSNEIFENTGEWIDKPEDHNEPWVYDFQTEPLSNGKKYGLSVSFYGHPTTNLDLDDYTDVIKNSEGDNVPIIEEA